MTKKKLVNFLLICSLSLLDIVTSAEDVRSTIFERPLRAINQHRCNADKKDYDVITEYKRLPEHRFVAEYKRFPDYRYSFGIGKRWTDDSIKRTLPYSFGVGKRNTLGKIHLRMPVDYAQSLDNDNFSDEILDSEISQMKRSAPLRTYDFGIGKRDSQFDHLNLFDANRKLNDDEQVWEQN